MRQESWKSELDYLQFCNRLGYHCPKCKAWLPLDENPTMARGCDILMDQCSSCGVGILIDNISSPDSVIIEGYDNSTDLKKKLLETKSKAKAHATTPFDDQPIAKKWWEFWK